MLSVLAHTGGDTLRTLAALAAAITATVDRDISGTLADAWSCIVVTVTIVILVIPLLMEINKAWNREKSNVSTMSA